MRCAIVVALALSSVAHAEPQQAETDTPGGFLLPALQLSASTDDQGKFKAAIPYKLPIESNRQFIVSARLQIASAKGVSALLSSSSGASLPWEGGLGLLIVEPQTDDAKEAQRGAGDAKVRAYDLCARECTGPKCDFKTDAPYLEKRIINKAKLCPNGLALYLREEAALVGLRSIPESRYSLGAALGRQRFKYLTGAFGAGNTVATASSVEGSVRGGALYTHAWALQGAHAGVIEIRGLYSRTHNAASGTGRWCQPEGMVGSDPSSSIQQCQDLALGAPSTAASFTLAADVGVVDSVAQSWRASVGMFSTTGITNTQDAFGIELPIYFNFTPGASIADYVGSYKGLLRITPRLSWTRDSSGHFPTTVVLMLEALAQDSIFSEVLDY